MTINIEFEEGWQAFMDNKIIENCPYLYDTTNYRCWIQGWIKGFKSHIEFYENKSEITIH